MEKLPTIAELYSPRPLDELVRQIRGFASWHITQQIDFVRDLIRDSPQFNATWGGSWAYRRVRTLGREEMISAADGLIWHPTKPARAGRINPAGLAMLYVGDRPDTAFSEARVKDDRVTMTTFQVQRGRSFRVVTVGELAQLHRSGRGYFILSGEAAAAQFLKLINAGEPDRVRAMLIIDSFLLQCLSDPKEKYELSATVATAIFEKLPELSAFAYPSVRQPGSINIAIRTAGFWQTWGIHAVRSGRATHLEQGIYRFTDEHHVCGIDADGALTWSEKSAAPRCFVPPWHPGLTSTMEDEVSWA